jgi:hypothetical protein
MTRSPWMLALLGTAAFTVACGESEPPEAAGPAGTGGATGSGGASGTGGASGSAGSPAPEPANEQDCSPNIQGFCVPNGFPFARVAFSLGAACEGVCTGALPSEDPLRFSQPEPGKLCLAGTNTGPELSIVLGFTLLSETTDAGYKQVLGSFNAKALGITQVSFTVDNPPPGGVFLWADTLIRDRCFELECVQFGFELPIAVTEAGPATVSFADFTKPAGVEFDLRALNDLGFEVGVGPIDFCISDVRFLDTNGAEVRPR